MWLDDSDTIARWPRADMLCRVLAWRSVSISDITIRWCQTNRSDCAVFPECTAWMFGTCGQGLLWAAGCRHARFLNSATWLSRTQPAFLMFTTLVWPVMRSCDRSMHPLASMSGSPGMIEHYSIANPAEPSLASGTAAGCLTLFVVSTTDCCRSAKCFYEAFAVQ